MRAIQKCDFFKNLSHYVKSYGGKSHKLSSEIALYFRSYQQKPHGEGGGGGGGGRGNTPSVRKEVML